jgi:hypothetical protein
MKNDAHPLGGEFFGAWPDPLPLRDDLPAVEPFHLEFLPDSFRPLVEDTAERMQVPLDFPGVVAICSLAGSVNRRARIQPRREDTSWQVIPNLWGGIVAPPGYMKSPVLKAITAPLVDIESLWRHEFKCEQTNYKNAAEEAEMMLKHWESRYREALRDGDPKPTRPDVTVREPLQKRLIVQDVTTERLHEILSENPAGVYVIRDELVGWIAEMEKPDRGNQRAFYLQAWNGDQGFTLDRIGRGSIHAEAVCVSVVGNIQPSRLRAYLTDAFSGGPMDDGLLQRLQLLSWPDSISTWRLVDRCPDRKAAVTASKVFEKLTSLPAEWPTFLRFCDMAQELFYEWLTSLEHKIREPNGLSPFLVSHLSKYRSLLPSLAGLNELADRAAQDNLESAMQIDFEHTQQAVRLCSYLESHALRTYSCVGSSNSSAVYELAKHIQRGDLKDTFTTRDVYRRGWAGLQTAKDAESALATLKSKFWIRPGTATSPLATNGGRPPSWLWRVNPKLEKVSIDAN